MATDTEAPAAPAAARSAAPRTIPMNFLFTAAILTSALLLFAVQPMVSKLLLPPYGGAAAVWTTSLLFFQTVLLAGYAYAHYAPRLLGRLHPLIHTVLVLVPLLVLPIALPEWSVPREGVPTALWLLLVLCVMIGLPFAVLSTTGPLVQEWYSRLGLPRSKDPYFLYAASNVGSLGALIAYPFVVEPTLGTGAQALVWTGGYILFALLIAGCALAVRRYGARTTEPAAEPAPETDEASAHREEEPAVPAADPSLALGTAEDDAPPAAGRAVTWRRRLLWIGLAALPSSLMQGVTTYMSTDVAAVPMLWVVPLALFLGTYIIAFGVRKHGWVAGTVDICLVLLLPLVGLAFVPDLVPTPVAMLLALIVLTVAALACHGLLAADRPEPSRLTEFFMLTSLGGALGSLFNGIVAPIAFDRTLEYPLALVTVALLGLLTKGSSRVLQKLFRDRAARIGVLACALGAIGLAAITQDSALIFGAAVLAAPAVLFAMPHRQVAVIALTALGLTVVGAFGVVSSQGKETGRTFFGSYAIGEDGERRSLAHGTTVHGFQLLDPAERGTPVSYYSESGPVGDVFAAYGADAGNVGVVGLGTGVIAAYGTEGQQFDFFEIDPEMVRLASDPDRFTFLGDCACDVETHVGDGRLLVAEREPGTYDVLMLDAFTSDAIPTHLLTREALQEFAGGLGDGGVLAVHISNRNLDLAPMVGATAAEAGLHGAIREDDNRTASGDEADPNAHPSNWLVLAADPSDLDSLSAGDAQHADEWKPLPTDGPVWTDSYSSLLPLLTW